MIDDLKIIKKHYGESMMNLCRSLFPSELENEGLLPQILEETFAKNKSIANDIIDQKKEESFQNHILAKINVEETILAKSDKNPYELMKEAGYTLYKCNSNEEILKYKKYYNELESLCTFDDNRLERYDVFFALKENAENLKRSIAPKREDHYGSSVISIQFYLGQINNVSIKSRYNHSVYNPDATFNNKLDNIISGLTDSFEKEFGYNIHNSKINSDFELKGYNLASDDKFYKYNLEINAVYYCTENVVIKDKRIETYEKERYILIENYLLDLKEKKMTCLSGKDHTIENLFEDIDKIKVIKKDSEKIIELFHKNKLEVSSITIDKNNKFVKMNLPSLKHVSSNFMFSNINMTEINLPNVESISNSFLYNNIKLNKLYLPNVTSIGNDFMTYNKRLTMINLPKVRYIGKAFLRWNLYIKEVYIPNVETIDEAFMYGNELLNKLELSKVNTIGSGFLYNNKKLDQINLMSVTEIGNEFIYNNKDIKEVNLPNVLFVGDNFLAKNEMIKSVTLPSIKKIGKNFIPYNKIIDRISLPEVEKIGDDFLYENKRVKKLEFNYLRDVGCRFMYKNKFVKQPKLLYLRNMLSMKLNKLNHHTKNKTNRHR